MLNFLWSFMIIFSIILSFYSGKTAQVISAAMNGAGEGITLCLSMMGIICMWNGIMKIAAESGITDKLTKLLTPVLKKIFKGISFEDETGRLISMNITANLLGMGNAATPPGLEAMSRMSCEKKNEKNMIMFTALNTVSFQIIPSTIIALRESNGGTGTGAILLPIWAASAASVLAVVLCVKIFAR